MEICRSLSGRWPSCRRILYFQERRIVHISCLLVLFICATVQRERKSTEYIIFRTCLFRLMHVSLVEKLWDLKIVGNFGTVLKKYGTDALHIQLLTLEGTVFIMLKVFAQKKLMNSNTVWNVHGIRK